MFLEISVDHVIQILIKKRKSSVVQIPCYWYIMLTRMADQKIQGVYLCVSNNEKIPDLVCIYT